MVIAMELFPRELQPMPPLQTVVNIPHTLA